MVIGRVRHPGRGFTQGLIEQDGTVWESTGLYGSSALCRYRLGDERAERSAALPADLFGEGICRAGDVIWQLTWRERVALRWDASTLEPAGQVRTVATLGGFTGGIAFSPLDRALYVCNPSL